MGVMVLRSLAAAVVALASKGMNKSGTQTMVSNAAIWQQVTEMVADTTNYPGSVVTSDKLEVPPGEYLWIADISWGEYNLATPQRGRVIDGAGTVMHAAAYFDWIDEDTAGTATTGAEGVGNGRGICTVGTSPVELQVQIASGTLARRQVTDTSTKLVLMPPLTTPETLTITKTASSNIANNGTWIRMRGWVGGTGISTLMATRFGILVPATGNYNVRLTATRSGSTVGGAGRVMRNGVMLEDENFSGLSLYVVAVGVTLNAGDLLSIQGIRTGSTTSGGQWTAGTLTVTPQSAEPYVVPEPPWRNKVSGIAAKNGTTSHTISFGFTPSVGSLLLAFVSTAATNSLPTGWTQVVDVGTTSKLSVWSKVSDGTETDLTTTHNGSDYASAYTVYEFRPGSSVLNSAAATPGTSNTFPAVGSLPITEKIIIGALGGINTSTTTTWSASWGTGYVEDQDQNINKNVTDGTYLTLGRMNNSVSPSVTPTGTFSNTIGDRNRVSIAVQAIAG